MSRTYPNPHRARQLTRAFLRADNCLCVAICLTLAGASTACVKLPHHAHATVTETAVAVQRRPSTTPLVNINTATLAELDRLPGIGPGLAARIIEHRTRYGPFRRTEHLLIVPGISERRFAEMRPFISTE
jgi:competence ComEA-like helix-hairpin-helix protein